MAWQDVPATTGDKTNWVDVPPTTQGDEIAQLTALPGLDPRTATTGDYLSRLYQLGSSGFGQLGSSALDYGRNLANSYGLLDRALASAKTSGFQQDPQTGQWISVNDPAKEAAALADERQKTAEASARIGPAATFVANWQGGGPLGKLNLAGKAADLIAPTGKGFFPAVGRWASGVASGAAEGAGVSATAAAGRGEDPFEAARWGGLFGAGGSSLGGVTSGPAGPKLPIVKGPLATTSDLEAAADAANQKLRSVFVDRQPVADNFKNAGANMEPGDKSLMSSQLESAINDVSKQIRDADPILSVDSIAKFQRSLLAKSFHPMNDKLTRSDQRLAQPYIDALNNVLDNEQPLTKSAGTHPTYNTGDARGLVEDANDASNQHQTSAFFDRMLKNPGEAPALVKEAINKYPQYYKAPGLSDEMNAISKMGSSMGPSWYLAHHILGPMLIGGPVGSLIGPHTGEGEFADRTAGFLGGTAIMMGINAAQRKLIADRLRNAQFIANMTGRQAPGPFSTAGDIGQQLLRLTGRAGALNPPSQ